MNDGGKGDGHSRKNVIWRWNNFHQLLALDDYDLASGVVALGKFDVLHVEHIALAKRTAKIRILFLLSFFGLAQVLSWEPTYITNLIGHDLTIIVVRNLLFISSCGINMDVIHLLVLFEH